MGMDLTGAGGYFRWGMGAWYEVLTLALAHGWEPIGTRPPPNRTEWDGNYDWNIGQMVTAEDAQALAAAVRKAIPTVVAPEVDEETKDRYAVLSEHHVMPEGWQLTPYDTEGLKAKFARFASFCEAGTFVIE